MDYINIDWSNHEFWDHVINIGMFVLGCSLLIVASAALAFKDFGDD